MTTSALYPLCFEPIYQYRLWGGRRLAEWLKAPLPSDGPIGEAWLLSDRDEHPSRVAEGPLKGRTIAQLIEQSPKLFLGKLAQRFRTVQSTSTTLAFISMQRGECRAVYGSAQNLKTLMEAMKLVKMKFHVLPIWFSSDDLTVAAEAVAKIEQACVQWRHGLVQKRKDDAAIEAKRQAQSETVRHARQSDLQQQNGAQARALEKSIISEIKDFVESPKEKHLGVRQKYPVFVNWYQRMLSDGWELIKVDGALNDYGVAEWKSRVLEAGFVDAHLKMQHRQLGEYRDACYTVGYTLDKEFDIAREPLVTSCSDEA